MFFLKFTYLVIIYSQLFLQLLAFFPRLNLGQKMSHSKPLVTTVWNSNSLTPYKLCGIFSGPAHLLPRIMYFTSHKLPEVSQS